MPPIFILITILTPIIGGIFVGRLHTEDDFRLHTPVMAITLVTSVLAWLIIFFGDGGSITAFRFSGTMDFTLHLDGLGSFFAGIIATLWPLTTLYAFEYLRGDGRQNVFFAYFLISFGVTLGVAMSGNLITLYCFYELLTLSTVPLVLYTKTPEAVRATRTYLVVSIGGAAFAFLSVIHLATGGRPAEAGFLTQFFYLLGFFGFGVKAAVFPLHGWLPKASVAPTPVTGLLHAVAVVKSGVFAIIRLTWFGYGVGLIRDTAAQYIALGFVMFTIVFGSAMAVKEKHFKRRMAYSTVANLSYILFGALLLTDDGLVAGLLHMAFHAEIKLLLFFCVGTVMVHTGRQLIYELDGLGKRMKYTFACFTAGALALTGIPPLSGFVSKWYLLSSSLEVGTWYSWTGAAAILISALLTAIYCFEPVRRAYFPDKKVTPADVCDVYEAGPCMLVPLIILSAGILFTGLFAGEIEATLAEIVSAIVPW